MGVWQPAGDARLCQQWFGTEAGGTTEHWVIRLHVRRLWARSNLCETGCGPRLKDVNLLQHHFFTLRFFQPQLCIFPIGKPAGVCPILPRLGRASLTEMERSKTLREWRRNCKKKKKKSPPCNYEACRFIGSAFHVELEKYWLWENGCVRVI